MPPIDEHFPGHRCLVRRQKPQLVKPLLTADDFVHGNKNWRKNTIGEQLVNSLLSRMLVHPFGAERHPAQLAQILLKRLHWSVQKSAIVLDSVELLFHIASSFHVWKMACYENMLAADHCLCIESHSALQICLNVPSFHLKRGSPLSKMRCSLASQMSVPK